MTTSTSAIVEQLVVDTSEPMDTLSISCCRFLAVSLMAIATMPITPAIDNRVMMAMGKVLLVLGAVEVENSSSADTIIKINLISFKDSVVLFFYAFRKGLKKDHYIRRLSLV